MAEVVAINVGHVAHLCELSQAHSDRRRAKAARRRRRLDQAAHAGLLVVMGAALMLALLVLGAGVPHV